MPDQQSMINKINWGEFERNSYKIEPNKDMNLFHSQAWEAEEYRTEIG